jgi:predicted ATPase
MVQGTRVDLDNTAQYVLESQVLGHPARVTSPDNILRGGPAGHGADRMLFAELMLSWDMRSWAEARDGLNFYDRGVPELVGYLRLCGFAVPEHFERAARLCRYAEPIFVAPPWADIYSNDEDRTQDFAEAVATYEAVRSAYAELGYRLADLPFVDVETRAGFVLGCCGGADSRPASPSRTV